MHGFLSRWRYEVLAVAVFAVFAVVHLTTADPVVMGRPDRGALHRGVQTFEARVSNILFRIRGERPAHPDVVVLELDEAGAQRFGRWPWPRAVMAQLFERLLDAGASVVGLDMAFTDVTEEAPVYERERGWLAQLAAVEALPEPLAALKGELEAQLRTTPDEALAAAFRKGGGRIVQGVIPLGTADAATIPAEVLARYGRDAAPEVITRLPGRVPGSFFELQASRLQVHRHVAVQTPLPVFVGLGSRLGHFGTVPDGDSTVRRAPILVGLERPEGLIPSLGLQTAAVHLGATIVPAVDGDEVQGAWLRGAQGGERLVPMPFTSPYTLINYPGGADAFRRLSAAAVYEGRFDPAAVKGKAVLVGVTIVGSSGDQRVTPFSEFTAGVFTHASLVSNILSGDYLEQPYALRFVELLVMLALGLGLAAVTSRVRSFAWKIVAFALVLAGYSVATQVLFGAGYRLAWVVPFASLAVTAFGTIFLGYLSVDREKLKMRSTFSRYLGEEVMDVALQNPERLNRGEKREMTVLFSDIRGFTTLSEKMSPEALADFINQYLSPMTKIVFDEKGTLDKYIGDAVMAFWNAPLDQPDHAVRACRAAVAMLARLDELKKQWQAQGFPELEIGIGVNTGPMVVGNMGSDVRVDYTVLGDSVNLGARLEGTNKEYGTRIIVSEFTWAAAKDALVGRRLGAVRVKGKQQPVGIYELRGVGRPTGVEAEAIAAFEAALVAWRGQRFEEARAGFARVLTLWPGDAPSQNYLAALEELKASPPGPDWDGVVSLKTK